MTTIDYFPTFLPSHSISSPFLDFSKMVQSKIRKYPHTPNHITYPTPSSIILPIPYSPFRSTSLQTPLEIKLHLPMTSPSLFSGTHTRQHTQNGPHKYDERGERDSESRDSTSPAPATPFCTSSTASCVSQQFGGHCACSCFGQQGGSQGGTTARGSSSSGDSSIVSTSSERDGIPSVQELQEKVQEDVDSVQLVHGSVD